MGTGSGPRACARQTIVPTFSYAPRGRSPLAWLQRVRSRWTRTRDRSDGRDYVGWSAQIVAEGTGGCRRWGPAVALS